MLYMIGGPPRMGKSALAQRLLKEQGLAYVSTDALTVMLKPMGEPSFYSEEKSARFFPMLDTFARRMLASIPDYAIEGDAFSPHHVVELQQKYEVRSVFLVMTSVSTTDILKFAHYDNWASEDTPQQLDELAARIVVASRQIQEECAHYDIPCVDMSSNYEVSFDGAYKLLTQPG